MTMIDLTASPADIFKAAAVDCHKAALALEAAKARISAEQAAYDNANANLQWVAAHPALADVDKNALYKEATANVDLEDIRHEVAAEPEAKDDRPDEKPAEAPKRKRRSKAEMEAARAAEAAAKNPPANESDDAAQQVEGQGISTPTAVEEPAQPTPAQAQSDFDPFAGAPAPAVPTPSVAPQAPPAAVASNDFDPFGTGN